MAGMVEARWRGDVWCLPGPRAHVSRVALPPPSRHNCHIKSDISHLHTDLDPSWAWSPWTQFHTFILKCSYHQFLHYCMHTPSTHPHIHLKDLVGRVVVHIILIFQNSTDNWASHNSTDGQLYLIFRFIHECECPDALCGLRRGEARIQGCWEYVFPLPINTRPAPPAPPSPPQLRAVWAFFMMITRPARVRWRVYTGHVSPPSISICLQV